MTIPAGMISSPASFAPDYRVNEDPVTGSLIVAWDRIGIKDLIRMRLSLIRLPAGVGSLKSG